MFVLSKVHLLSEKIKTHCPICLFMCRDHRDTISILEEDCCTECFINFRFVMAEDWDSGIRPKASEARSKMGFDLHN